MPKKRLGTVKLKAFPAKKPPERVIKWEASSKKDLQEFPQAVQDIAVFALEQARQGLRHPDVKTLTGFGGGSVLEVVENHDGDTYRAVYTIKYQDAVWVVHCFQKKSKVGIATPPRDMKIIENRLRRIESYYRKRTSI